MHLTFRCPGCRHLNRSDVLRGADGSLACADCGWRKAIADSDVPQGRPRRCLVCGNDDLWRQKDFPQRLGLFAVAAGAILSSVAWYYHRPLTAIGVLMAFALADMLLFALMPDVLVCYRCQARHHGADPAADYPTFNHELAERYRQEQIRLRAAHAGGGRAE